MYKGILFNSEMIDKTPGWSELSYTLQDSDFTAELDLILPNDAYVHRGLASIIPSALISAYTERELSDNKIAKNLARFYYSTGNEYSDSSVLKFLQTDCEWTERWMPQYKFEKNYLNCTWRQFKTIRYTGYSNAPGLPRAVLPMD